LTVAAVLKPGVAVAIAKRAKVSLPSTILSTAQWSVREMALPMLSCVMMMALLARTIDDGVRAPAIASVYVLLWSSAPVASVIANVRDTDSNVTPAVGVRVAVATNVAFGDSKYQPESSLLPKSGMTTTIFPPTATRPRVVNVIVATVVEKGESLLVSKVALGSWAGRTASTAHSLVRAMAFPWSSSVDKTALVEATTEDGVRTPEI
jgi:hypothetical protein